MNRDQLIMFPQSLDEHIGEDNPVRFIDAFVDGLDLRELGFQRAVPAETGRPPYHPGNMTKLYIYGYLNRVRSSRRLERESQRNTDRKGAYESVAQEQSPSSARSRLICSISK